MFQIIQKKSVKPIVLFLLTIFLASCSGEEGSNPDGNGTDDPVADEVTSLEIKIEDEKDLYLVGEELTFTVTANGDQNVTGEAKLYVNDEEISGSKFTPTEEMHYNIKAKYKEKESSNSVNVSAEKKGDRFEKNLIIEDFTGTWCGYCPRVSYAMEKVYEQTDNVIGIAAHISSGTPDPMENEYSLALLDAFDVSGFPTAYLDRFQVWQYPEDSANGISQATDKADPSIEIPFGIKMASTVTNTEMEVSVAVKFGNSVKKDLKITVLVLEDGIVEKQSNYTSHYGGVNPINDFVHDHVLRYSFTHITGKVIPRSKTEKGDIYEEVFKADIPSTIADKSKLSFVAIVSYAASNASYNARMVKANDSNEYQVK